MNSRCWDGPPSTLPSRVYQRPPPRSVPTVTRIAIPGDLLVLLSRKQSLMGTSILFTVAHRWASHGEVGSPLYDLMPEHLTALWAMGLAVTVGLLLSDWPGATL